MQVWKTLIKSWLAVAPVFVAASFAGWGKWFMPEERVEAIVNTPWYVVGVVALALLPFASTFKLLLGVFGVGGLSRKERDRIVATGIPGKAVLASIDESSQGTVTINDQPLLRLTFEVTDGYHQPYKAAIEKVIPRTELPNIQPGVAFDVRVDRADPRKIVFLERLAG